MSPSAAISIASPEGRTLPILLTVDEVADVLRVNPRTVERWSAEGRLQRVDLGPRTVRYRATDVAALIDPTHSEAPATNQGSAEGLGRVGVQDPAS